MDEPSLALCHYLMRAAEAEGDFLYLLAVARPSSVASRLEASLGQVLKPERLARLHLGPLDLADGVRLAQAVNATLTADAAAELWEQSPASPFWLQVLAVSGGRPDIANLMTARWASLTPDAPHVLAVIAIAARPIPIGELGRIQSWTVDRTVRAVAELERIGTAVASAGEVRLAHDLVRTAAEAGIAPPPAGR